MHSKLILIASLGLAAAATAQTFQIPRDLADGAYIVSLDHNSASVFTQLEHNTTAVARRGDAEVQRRQVSFPSGSGAVCNQPLVNDNDMFGAGQAWDQMFNACSNLGGAFLKNKQALFFKAGTATAFMCNYSSKGNPCNTAEWEQAIGNVRNACADGSNGRDQTGYFNIPGWKKSYGFTQSSLGFC